MRQRQRPQEHDTYYEHANQKPSPWDMHGFGHAVAMDCQPSSVTIACSHALGHRQAPRTSQAASTQLAQYLCTMLQKQGEAYLLPT